jgi:hypothetical protein
MVMLAPKGCVVTNRQIPEYVLNVIEPFVDGYRRINLIASCLNASHPGMELVAPIEASYILD